MAKTSVSSRVCSVVLAAALTCTLVPAEGMAFADESTKNEAIEQIDAQDAESAEADAVAQDDQAEAALAERVNEDAVLEQTEAAETAEGAVVDGSAVAESDIEITRTSVNLADEAATVFGYNGLVYQVNNDDPDTVALVDWTGTAPEGDLQIPTEAIAAGKVYSVTRINAVGGGSLK